MKMTTIALLLLAATGLAQIDSGRMPQAPAVPTGTITGNLTTTSGLMLANSTLTFSLSQPAVVAATFSLAQAKTTCYTDGLGKLQGIPDPVAPPVVASSPAGGRLATGIYYLTITYVGADGESIQSAEAAISLASEGSIEVKAPELQPSLASGYRIYASSTRHAETLQGSVAGFTSFRLNQPLVEGPEPPLTNRSSCHLWFSDNLIPSGTFYTVDVVNSGGLEVDGYPQTWCTYGGATGRIAISDPTLREACGTKGVLYPAPLLTRSDNNRSPNAGERIWFHGESTVGKVSPEGVVPTKKVVRLDGLTNKTVQECIAAAGTGGACIVPSEFKSTITTGLTILTDRTTLICEKDATIVKGGNLDMITISGSGDVVTGCTFDGQQPTFTGGAIVLNGASSALIENNLIENSSRTPVLTCAVLLNGASRNVIRANRILDTGACGILGANNSNSNIVVGNYVDTTPDAGTHLSSSVMFHGQTAGKTVDDNQILNNVILHGTRAFCLEVGDFSGKTVMRTVVAGNICKLTSNGSSGGFSMGGDGAITNDGAVVVGNLFESNGFSFRAHAFEANNVTRSTYAGNTAKITDQNNPNLNGIGCDPCQNTVFAGNIIKAAFSRGPSQSGIALQAGNANGILRNNLVTGNIVDLTGTTASAEAYLLQCNHRTATCSNNEFSGNIALGVNMPGDAAVWFLHSSGTMRDNKLEHNSFGNFHNTYSLDSGTYSGAKPTR